MKITAIKTQVKRAGRYSIFVNGQYVFSLSADGLLDSKITVGLEVTDQQIGDFQRLSDQDKIYDKVLNYLAIRPRSEWEIETYLQRKKVSPTLLVSILSKLSNKQLINDLRFAEAFVNDRRLLRPTSRRKLILELRKKRVADNLIQQVVGNEPDVEQSALAGIVERKRKQSRYQDDLKLMQYLARQGFNYGDIKQAISNKQLDELDFN
jgi:regulatory protein